jgi:DNA sulfur modification protein DndB
VADQIPEWKMVRERRITAGEVRRDFIHSHGIVLHALGRVGNSLLTAGTPAKKALAGLKGLDWSRSASKLWEGRAFIGGRVTKADQNVVLTTNLIKKQLKLPLGPEEQRAEDALQRGNRG